MTERSGDCTREVLVPRGRTSQTACVQDEPKYDNTEDDVIDGGGVNFSTFDVTDHDPGLQEPSLHAIKQKSNVSAWNNVREDLRRVAVECSAMPIDQECILCPSPAEYRCIECAAWAFYCSECFGKVHSKVGIFHTGEIWQVNCTTQWS